MKVCIAEGFMFRNVPLEKSLKDIAKIGFDSVELMWGVRYHAEAKDEEIKELRRSVKKHGLKVSAVLGAGPLASPDEAVRAGAVKMAKRQIAIARMLDADMVTAEMNGGNSTQRGQCVTAFKTSVQELLPDLEREEVNVSFEPHPGDFIEESTYGVDVLRSIGSSHIGYLYCCPHTFVLGGDPAEMIEYAGPLLNYVHIADSHRMERSIVSLASRGLASVTGVPEFEGMKVHEHLVPGHGEVPFDSVFRGLKRVGYKGPVSCIPFSPDSPAEAARESYKAVKKYMRKAK